MVSEEAVEREEVDLFERLLSGLEVEVKEKVGKVGTGTRVEGVEESLSLATLADTVPQAKGGRGVGEDVYVVGDEADRGDSFSGVREDG